MSGPTLKEAQALIEHAQQRAFDLGKAISIAVVDYGGYAVAGARMDGARPMTPSIALAKAYSAAVMQRPTAMRKAWSNGDPVFFSQVARMGHQPIVATLGGYTLKREEEILGGIGIAGGSAEEDEAIARAVVEAVAGYTPFPAWPGARKDSN